MYCLKGECEGILAQTNVDNRSEWIERTYECEECGAIHTHRTEYDQQGLVINDDLYLNDGEIK